MKKFFICLTVLSAGLLSCVKEAPRSELLEFKIGTKAYTYNGFAYQYTDYLNDIKKGFDWHIYNHGQYSLYIQAYDTTFIENLFQYPAFSATLSVELPGGKSKTYNAVSGEFRITGEEMNEIIGDFRFKVKNIADQSDSLMITEGFFRIWLERYTRRF